MIHLITRGGLGNQMFQYAMALQIAKRNRCGKIWINGEIHPFSIDKRQQSLYHFCLNGSTHVCSRCRAWLLIACFVLKFCFVVGFRCFLELLKTRRLGNTMLQERLLRAGLYYTSNPYSMPEIQESRGTKHIYAYAQTPDAISGIEDELREAFAVRAQPSAENAALLSEINSCNAVCLHIRRGDYSLYPAYQVCDEAYYTEAVCQAVASLSSPVFYVFSNTREDIQWIKDHYHFDADVRYVELENPDYEELRLMMRCNHFIISNSTFSWWAAVLSSRCADAKRVWAPARWFNGADVRMTLDEWTLI